MIVLGIDPGETTGVSLFRGPNLLKQWQIRTKRLPDGLDLLRDVITSRRVDVIACEDYRVYSWESDKHKWAALHTPKLVGAIHAIAHIQGVVIHLRMAQEAKTLITDNKLMEWGLYEKGERHARDATRHALLYLVSVK